MMLGMWAGRWGWGAGHREVRTAGAGVWRYWGGRGLCVPMAERLERSRAWTLWRPCACMCARAREYTC
eukprot:scaffold214505_cov14-Tisochrysis_lutea.AAC.1